MELLPFPVPAGAAQRGLLSVGFLEGNEKADTVENQAAALDLVGPQPECSISRSTAYRKIDMWFRSEYE